MFDTDSPTDICGVGVQGGTLMGMTREEKLDWLYRLKSEIFVLMPKEWIKPMSDALGDVIKALEQESTTKNNLGVDCISRQDVLSEIIRFSTEEGASVECQQLYCDVNNMPPVTPQPCEDAISRKEVLNQIFYSTDNSGDVVLGSDLRRRIERISPVTPQELTDKIFTKAELDSIVKAINEGWELRVNEVLDEIRSEIEQLSLHKAQYLTSDNKVCIDSQDVFNVIDKYKAEIEPQECDIEIRKPCINYEDGCEEWAGCPCVYYKGRK